MIPTNEQHVKCILKNGAVVEGIVKEWGDASVQLQSLDGESILIIPHPNEDIMLIKIVLEKPKLAPESIEEKIIAKEVLEEKVQQTTEEVSDDLRLKKLAELKILLNQQERKIISEKMRSHEISPYMPRKSPYETPNWMKIKSAYKPGKLPGK